MPPAIITNQLTALPAEIQLHIMTHLANIYTLKNLLDAFPDELQPVFQPYAKSVLNAIFWRPMRSDNVKRTDERGVVFRWMLRELHLEHLMEQDEKAIDTKQNGTCGKTATIATTTAAAPVSFNRPGKYLGRITRPILCDDNDID